MSFPPGPPLHIPGLPPPMMAPPTGWPPMGPMIPMTVGMMPPPMMGPVAMSMPPHLPMPPHPKMQMKKPNMHQMTYKREAPETPDIMKGPPVTVFVGNITERAPDNLVRQILQRCGIVLNWKRVQGANGKLQAFGFCEYGEPEAALRAIRLLHEYELGNKKLVVKVDAKTKEKLDEYKAKAWAKPDDDKEPKETDKEEGEDSDDTLDEMTKQRDEIIRSSLESLIRAHEVELSKPIEHQESPPPVIVNTNDNRNNNHRSSSNQDSSPKPRVEYDRMKKSVRSRNELDEMDLEDDKKTLIHREIDKFRDTYKRAEEEKEKEKDRSGNSSRASRRREYESPEREPSRNRDRGGDRERERGDRERERRHRDRVKEDGNSNRRRRRSRDRSNRSPRASPVVTREIRERSRERQVERSRSASHDRDAWNRERDHPNENRSKEKEYDKEEEEEVHERKKQERKLREKEAIYQERLRNWEGRERRRIKDYEKEKSKGDEQKKNESKEARRLKEFLEDYDDERDDPKYFKGSALLRRMKEREKEIDDDFMDRQKEKEELDELRKKLAEEGHPDPDAEVERFLLEESRLVEPSIKEETPDSDQEPEKQPPRAKMKPISNTPASPIEPNETIKQPKERKLLAEDDNTQNSFSGFSDLVPREEAKPLGFTSLRIGGSPTQTAAPSSPMACPNNMAIFIPTKRKMTVDEVFNANDEDETEQKKKRKLIPLDDSQDDATKNSSGVAQMSVDEKRQHIKNLIEKIPTEKVELFAYTLDWTMVDKVLMEKRIRPWINKKIIEYIGEEEPTLVEFICSKVMMGSAAQSILDDVSMVLDEEAEVFVVKMWRLLIYEIEAKKLGLVCKTTANSQPENFSQGKS